MNGGGNVFLAGTGFSMILVAAALRLWAALTLLHTYRVEFYLSDPSARKLWITATVTLPTIGFGIALCSLAPGIWWVGLAGCSVFAFTIYKCAWIVYMRRTGKYRDFYRRMQWQ